MGVFIPSAKLFSFQMSHLWTAPDKSLMASHLLYNSNYSPTPNATLKNDFNATTGPLVTPLANKRAMGAGGTLRGPGAFTSQLPRSALVPTSAPPSAPLLADGSSINGSLSLSGSGSGVGRFEVLRTLGEGTCSKVKLARDLRAASGDGDSPAPVPSPGGGGDVDGGGNGTSVRAPEYVALKIIKKQQLALCGDPTAQKLKREIHIHKRLRHPNILQLLRGSFEFGRRC